MPPRAIPPLIGRSRFFRRFTMARCAALYQRFLRILYACMRPISYRFNFAIFAQRLMPGFTLARSRQALAAADRSGGTATDSVQRSGCHTTVFSVRRRLHLRPRSDAISRTACQYRDFGIYYPGAQRQLTACHISLPLAMVVSTVISLRHATRYERIAEA